MIKEIKDRISKLFGYENAKDDDMYYMKKKHIDWLIEQAEKVEQLKNTIKETLETLKRGGPGTRSQVQRLLEQALERKE